MKTLIKEAAGYGLASAVALLVDMALLWLLVSRAGWRSVPAASVSFLAGAVVAYWLSIRIAFHNHRMRNRHAEFAAFIAIGSVGLGVNAGVISLASGLLGLHYMLAKCIAAGFTFSWNFLARRQMLFVPRSPA